MTTVYLHLHDQLKPKEFTVMLYRLRPDGRRDYESFDVVAGNHAEATRKAQEKFPDWIVQYAHEERNPRNRVLLK